MEWKTIKSKFKCFGAIADAKKFIDKNTDINASNEIIVEIVKD